MMAVRERAVKVMAALERRVPCLDDFVGQSWSVLAERINLTASDGEWLRFHRFFLIFRWKKSFGCGLFSRKGTASLTNVTQTKNLPGPSAGRFRWFPSGPLSTYLFCWVGCESSLSYLVFKPFYCFKTQIRLEGENDTSVKSNRTIYFFFFFAKLERMHVDEQLSAQPLSLATELSHRANYSSGLPDCA